MTQFFSGRGLAVIERGGQPAPPVLMETASTHGRRIAEGEHCKQASDPFAARLVDIDGDGRHEAIAFYELSGCGGDAVLRIMTVFRQDEEGAWRPASDTALTVVARDHRPVLDIGNGNIVIAGGTDGFGGAAEPEVIAVPELPQMPAPSAPQ